MQELARLCRGMGETGVSDFILRKVLVGSTVDQSYCSQKQVLDSNLAESSINQ
jgi:hypothetical protein